MPIPEINTLPQRPILQALASPKSWGRVTFYGKEPPTKSEIARTEKSQNDLATIVFIILPLIIIVAALVSMVVSTPVWRAIGITTIALVVCLMFIDSNTSSRNSNYHQELLNLNK